MLQGCQSQVSDCCGCPRWTRSGSIPLAFPRNPYHHLVKHYQDGQLKRGRVNDPELDARLALEVFDNQQKELRVAPPDLLTAWHWLTTADGGAGFDMVFAALRRASRPSEAQRRIEAIRARLDGNACQTHAREVMADAAHFGWPLAYALAWLSVSGGNSVMPPWVRFQFPEAGRLVRRLRDTACTDPECEWCRERHDSHKELRRWFGFDDFRPEPRDDDAGRPMQQSVVEAAMSGRARAGGPAYRQRQVAVLPGPGPVPLRQDRRPDRGDLTAGRANGRPGQRP